MSAELPQLERLIADAAERHYGGRSRLRLPAPRLSLVAGLVAAAAAVVLAIAILPIRSDEQSASPPAADSPSAPLAKRYAVFARGQDAGARAFAIAEDQLRALDPRTPVAVRMLRSFDGGGIVAAAGTSRIGGEAAVCLSEQHAHVGGGGCIDVADLPAQRPWFPFGVPSQSNTAVTAFVPDSVDAVRMELKSGAARTVPIENNLAYAKAGERVCRVSWTTDGGASESQRSLPRC